MATPEIETTRISATVTIDVYPRRGQSLAEASAHFRRVFREYLERHDFPFWEDYGAAIEDIVASRSGDDDASELCWGGYDGPFVTNVSVRDDDAVQERAMILADPRDEGSIDPCQWPSALEQARHEWATERETYYPEE